MLTASMFKDFMKTKFPDTQFYAGKIDRSKPHCVGIYPAGRNAPIMAIGGPANSSYGVLGISILVHWGKATSACEEFSQQIFNTLFGLSDTIYGTVRLASVGLLDAHPIDLSADEDGIMEMVIRANVYYDKEVQ